LLPEKKTGRGVIPVTCLY